MRAPDSLAVTVVQPDVVWHDAEANRERLRRMLDARPPAAGGLIVLPETVATGFTSDVEFASDTPDGATARWFGDLAAEFDCHVTGGLIATDPLTGLGLNQAVTMSPDGVEVGRYSKMHRFPLSREADTFASGEDVEPFDIGGATVCPLVCYDLRFPETWRRGVGSHVFLCIANWPASRMHHWHALLRARAIENQAFVVGVNRTGTDPAVQYVGGSAIYDHDGRALMEMDERPTVATATLDLSAQRTFRRKLPFLPKAQPRRQPSVA